MICKVPDIHQLKRFMALMRTIVFPDYYCACDTPQQSLREILLCQLSTVLETEVEQTAEAFIAQLPEISRLLQTDVDAVLHNDPAVKDAGEVILCYPLPNVMLHYRAAHALYQLGVPRLPRMLTEMAHSRTGIDIHPAAQIADHFCIDHGTGVVIGETTIIGSHVVLYQGVTLGAKNFEYDEEGLPLDLPRHPIIEDHVTVYSNTSILGRVRIGHDTIVGGNIWLTQDVPANSVVRQSTPEIKIKTNHKS